MTKNRCADCGRVKQLFWQKDDAGQLHQVVSCVQNCTRERELSTENGQLKKRVAVLEKTQKAVAAGL